ncbi:MAG: hypothetical protein MR707_05765 [Galactobacillus timonensis]|uniref:VTT domain-containing protein n=1 Tax=Galactobacillus timonensis TaxID=2041840 RepID=UPI0023F1945B|nr:VTT domain-containing protein [Galactobacillus timonensis]MCI6067721.1 hypothetical protein [Galactobacillus timonensis]
MKRRKWFGIVYVVLLVVLYVFYRRSGIDLEDLVEAAPERIVPAVFTVLAFYALKSLTVFFPLPLLYLLSADIFPQSAAIVVNAAGLVVAATVPWIIGKRSDSRTLDQHMDPQTAEVIHNLKMDNPFLYTFALRATHLAYDPISMYLGSQGIPWHFLALGTLAGTGPAMAAITIIGENVFSPDSGMFWPAMGLLIGVVALSFFLLYHTLHRKYPAQYAYLKELLRKRIDEFFHKRKDSTV